MEEWRRFRLRFRDIIEEIDDRHPGFWTELRDLAETRDRRRTTTRGAVVREFPRTRDQGTQTPDGRTLGQRLFGVAPPEPRSITTQTEAVSARPVGIQTDDLRPTIAAEPQGLPERGRGRGLPTATLRRPGSDSGDLAPSSPPAPEPRRGLAPLTDQGARTGVAGATGPPTRGSTLCWNCRSTDHRYSNCPHPRDRQYCYGCGREGVTMRTCPGCRDEWRDLGPYRPERGHLGKR